MSRSGFPTIGTYLFEIVSVEAVGFDSRTSFDPRGLRFKCQIKAAEDPANTEWVGGYIAHFFSLREALPGPRLTAFLRTCGVQNTSPLKLSDPNFDFSLVGMEYVGRHFIGDVDRKYMPYSLSGRRPFPVILNERAAVDFKLAAVAKALSDPADRVSFVATGFAEHNHVITMACQGLSREAAEILLDVLSEAVSPFTRTGEVLNTTLPRSGGGSKQWP